MKVSWLGVLSTQVPVTEQAVAAWVLEERPDMVRGLTGTPTAEQLAAFLRTQPHLANLATGLYAQAQGLLPADAHIPPAVNARGSSLKTGARSGS